jgi:hypothetical protein
MPAERSMCSLVAAAEREDPIGMATPFDELLLIELPPPWPRKLWDACLPPAVANIRESAAAAGRRIRLLAIAPDDAYGRPGYTTLLHFRRPRQPFATYTRAEWSVPQDRRFELAAAILERAPTLEHFDRYRRDTAGVRDLVVCTNGSVDACCAKFGFPRYQQLRADYGAAGSTLRVWRSSHFGGHRFAPTMIDLPTGHYWAHVTPDAAERIVERNGGIAELRGHYRGWSGLRRSLEQVVEGEIWLRRGWRWVDYLKAGEILAVDGGPGAAKDIMFADRPPAWAEVRISWQAPDDEDAGAYIGRVELTGRAGMSGCGAETRWVNQYRVTHLEALASAPELALELAL